MPKFKHGRVLLAIIGVVAIAYISTCLLLFFRQRYLIFRPSPQASMLPSSSDFNLPYEDVWITVPYTSERIYGWWVPAPS